MNNREKRLLLSAGSVAVAIMLLGYAAYGWVSMSKDIRAEGKNISVLVPVGLEISRERDQGYATLVQVDLKTLVAEQVAAAGDSRLYDAAKDRFYLLPASSYNGVGTMWMTDTALADGSAPDGTVYQEGHRIIYSESSDDFEGHYIDVPLWLRTSSGNTLLLGLSELSTQVTAGDGDEDIESVVRVAFLNADGTGVAYGSDPLVYAGGTPGTPSVVAGTNETLAPKYMTFDNDSGLSNETVLQLPGADYSDGLTYRPVQVVLRIWIEGQDRSCVARIGGRVFNLAIGFSIKETI